MKGNCCRVISIIYGAGGTAGISIQEIISFLRAQTEGIGAFVNVISFFGIGNDAGLIHFYKCITEHFALNTYVFYIRGSQHISNKIGHGSNTQLQHSAVNNFLDNKLGNFAFFFAGVRGWRCSEDRLVGAFNYIINFTDMNIFIVAARAIRQVFVYFYDGNLAGQCQSTIMGIAQSKIKAAVVIHRSCLGNPNIRP